MTEDMPYRDPTAVERIVGKRRKAVQIGTGFYPWPLWQAYPTWQQYNEQLANERVAQEKAERAAKAPPYKPGY